MKQIMLDALGDAVKEHVVKLFSVLVTAGSDDIAVKRFETGIGNCLVAHERSHAVICAKCDE